MFHSDWSRNRATVRFAWARDRRIRSSGGKKLGKIAKSAGETAMGVLSLYVRRTQQGDASCRLRLRCALSCTGATFSYIAIWRKLLSK